MNNLSWFIYFVEVIPNISLFLLVSGQIALFGSLFIMFCSIPFYVESYDNDKPKYVEWYKLYYKRILPILVFILLIAILIPSKETMYLIAGSELGETVVTSQEGQEIMNDIHEIIKHQLGVLKGE